MVFKTHEVSAKKAYSISVNDEIWHNRFGYASVKKKELKKINVITSEKEILCESSHLSIERTILEELW